MPHRHDRRPHGPDDDDRLVEDVGVQVLGRRYDEAGLLDVGAVLEARLETLTPVDPR